MASLPRLYAITDQRLAGCGAEENVSRLLTAGVRLIQLRDKQATPKTLLESARACLRLTKDAGAQLIINDRVDVALASGADGVHLGQDDLGVDEARTLLGPEKIIGVSTHSMTAVRTGAQDIGHLHCRGSDLPDGDKGSRRTHR